MYFYIKMFYTYVGSLGLRLFFSVSHIDEVSEGDVLQGVAGLAHLLVHFVATAYTVANKEIILIL